MRLAIAITRSLVKIHQNGLIHGDVRPENLLLSGLDTCFFVGFGRSFSTQARFRYRSEQPTRFSLPYVSPEQTGRLEAVADERSDLYSLGITLYELLTGHLPFAARTTGEWIHSHLARPPLPPGRWVASIPSIIASILLKLISKPPEDRYQTAAGLEADLVAALNGLALGERVGFELGRADARGSLLIPSRLYGREHALEVLNNALEDARGLGASKLVLVAGPAGIGKSALLRSFRMGLEPERSLFAQGKFDQLDFTTPYTTLISALGDVVRDEIRRPVNQSLVAAIKEALGTNGRAITSLIPDLERLVGKQEDLPFVPPAEAQVRFHAVLSRFIRVFATSARPLILFFDDIQWIDQATLDFLDRTVIDSSIPNLLIIGAFRNNEVGLGHRLGAWLAKAGKLTLNIDQMVLSPLSKDELVALVADSLGSPRHEMSDLANEVHAKAEGNPLFSTQLLSSLADAGALSFSEVTRRWSFNRDRAGTLLTENISDLLRWKIDQLSSESRAAIIAMALFGNRVSNSLLLAALDQETAKDALEEASAAGLITNDGNTVAFFHDRIQEAAYELTPMDVRREMHLALARKMRAVAPQGSSDTVFEVVQQYSYAIDLIEPGKEALAVAKLSLTAGMKAEQASAFDAAVRYYETGLRLVNEQPNRDEDLQFEFEISIANCTLISGNPEVAEGLLRDLRSRTVGKSKRGRIAWTEITLFTALGRFDGAIRLCLDFLAEEGYRWSANPSWDDVQDEFGPVADEILQGKVSARAGLHACQNDDAILLDVLSAALPPAFFTSDRLVCLILCRMANISQISGNTASSALGYAYLGMVLGPMFDNFPAGGEFGELALTLVADPRYSRFKGRVAMTVAYHVRPYSRPIRSTRDLHRQALSIAQDSGDLTYAGFCTCTTVSNLLFAGDGLGAVEKRSAEGLEYAKLIGFGLIADIVTSQLMTVRSLRGATFELGQFNDGAFEVEEFERRLTTTPGMQIAECWHWVRRLQASVFARRFDEGLGFADKAQRLLWTSAGHLEYVEYSFYYSVALSKAAAQSVSLYDALSKIAKHLAFLEALADSSPKTFTAHCAIVKAQVARLEDRPIEALQLLDRAIAAARVQAFSHMEALGCELAAEVAEELDLSSAALAYREKSYAAYRAWGANAKLRALDLAFPNETARELHEIQAFADARAGGLDLVSVERSTATVSGEAVQSRMFTSLLSIAMENAGARHARLLTPKGGGLRLEAEVNVYDDGNGFAVSSDLRVAQEIPLEPAWQAFNSQELVAFETSPVESSHRSAKGSALYVPLVARGRSVGILYLENDLYAGAFPPARTSVIKLIAGQTAIALENASLDEKESLLREVHHRVKNNLQLISSLLSLQASHIEDPKTAELFQESRNRVRSMALVHENLYRAGNFARISMGGHLKTLCSFLSRAYGMQARSVSLSVEVDEDVELDLDRAISCGLIVNELVSNALKHAFPDGEPGSVLISMSRNSSSEFTLIVRDDGVGLGPGPVSRETLGLQLVHDLVDQLRGKLSFRCNGGTTAEITFAVAYE
ncbi:AAA family ATPase [Rhizobium sp. S152]|uniref:AAA family ATPase n=1 Tax=Rhizobium sp. S152 TaxID=3055038 RepID=UPI0025A96A25|nr:AAA family ATPase [Rhizobium sp. S152]MDM9627569.1 AAA family ATPase [Rhizobium sp. S152]